MSEKTCKKCNHTTTYNGLEPQSCPACGAVYAKVEETLRAILSARAERSSAAPVARHMRGASPDMQTFAAQMREESLYPAWRKIVGIFSVLGYVLAGLVLIGSIFAARESMGALFGGVVLAALIALMARVGKELSLMLADLSDAAVHMAASRERQD